MQTLADLTDSFRNIPDIWGEGAIFAFSGMDGETCAASQFVGTFGAERYDFLFHTPRRRVLTLRLPEPGQVRIATGDVLAAQTAAGALIITHSAWHTMVALLPAGFPVLSVEGDPPGRSPERMQSTVDPDHQDAIVMAYRPGRFALAYGRSENEAWSRAFAGLDMDPLAVAADRLSMYRKLPALASPERDRLLKKCVSVMRVNTLSKEAGMAQAWSTPDRVPHKDMWLWDTVFHSLAMNKLNPRLAWEELKSVLDAQNGDGMIPHQTGVTGRKSAITQPPLLAWGVWTNYQQLGDRSCLEFALPRLEQYLNWDITHRDSNGNGLLEWFIEGDVRCRSGESGLDNSPRFDAAILLDAVDFSTFAAEDMRYTALIAAERGDMDRARRWQERAAQMARMVVSNLWDETGGFYYDRDMSGQVSGVAAVSGFFPLLLEQIPPAHVQRLVDALLNPDLFKCAFPVPSVSLSHPEWSTDLWRGATWVNTNYLIIKGLVKHGRRDVAAWLAEETIAHVLKYYEQFGVLFEFFDAKDERPPVACDRKGPRREPYNIRVKMDSIRDYHWTAALTACLLLGDPQAGDPQA